MKRIKLIKPLLFISFLTLSTGILTSCDGLFETTKKVSTFEELMKVTREDNVVLTNDIDCNFQTITTRACKSFEGNGYTIKNFVLSASGLKDETAFFASYTKTIKNVVFEGATINGDQVMSLAVVKSCGGGLIENVHIKNCTLSATQSNKKRCNVGGIYAGVTASGGVYNDSFDAEIKNCSAENVEIKIEGYSKKDFVTGDLFAGAIAAQCNTITDSFASNCELSVISYNHLIMPYVGGLVGYTQGTITNSYAISNKITAEDTYYNPAAFSYYSTATVYAGGLIGCADKHSNLDKTNIQYCYSEGNDITVKSTGSIYAGGLVGNAIKKQISQSYAKNNIISGDKYVEGNQNDVERYYGGLVGRIKNSSINSSFTYNNKLEERSNVSKNNNSVLGGLVSLIEGTAINYCGTYKNEIYGPQTDEFCYNTSSSIYDCVVTSETFGNKNNCSLVAEDFWYTEDLIKNTLKLGGPYWEYSPTDLPTLVF